jgi:glycerol-3-phosphate dehydrogenase
MSADLAPRTGSTRPHAAIIGGGATGCAVARDLSLRGLRVTLLDMGDLGSGTSSRFHGMLQSGARYAVSDTGYAAECIRERHIVAGLIPGAVEPAGGLFVSLKEDPEDYVDKFVAGCREAGILVDELDPLQVMRDEPALSREVRRAFAVPDATINPWRLVNAMARAVLDAGGTVSRRCRVIRLDSSDTGTIELGLVGPAGPATVAADVVVNAAGAWSGRIAALAGQLVELELTKGSIIVVAHRIVHRVINRCRYPTSHDIIVPTGTVSLFGTTSEVVTDPGTTEVRPGEVQALLDGAAPLIPAIRQLGVLRAWAGVRPLVRPPGWPADRSVPRRHKIIDHGRSGFAGLFTVCGGSLTTHRSMAQEVCDSVCRYLGWNAPCTTAATPIEPLGAGFWAPAASYASTEASTVRPANLCECEAVSVADVSAAISRGETFLHDLRRRLRIGFGPCQGTFCGPRATQLVACATSRLDLAEELAAFHAERLKGMVLTGWGKQARQILLSEHVHRRIVGWGNKPAVPESAARP